MKKLFLLFFSIALVFGAVKEVNLSDYYPPKDILKNMYNDVNVYIPIPQRIKVQKLSLHLEFSPSKNLVKQRSSLNVFFNGQVVYRQKLDPNIDVYTPDIKIPTYLIKDVNKITVSVAQHYCMNCCENPQSPELWTQIFWNKSYLKVTYTPKKIKPNLLSYRDYVLDYKNFNPLHFGIITQTSSDEYITLASRLSGYLGSEIKYRKIYIQPVDTLKENMDIFIIGTKDYVKKLLHTTKEIPNIFIMPNPKYPDKAITVITATNIDNLKNELDAFITIPKKLLMGKSLQIQKFTLPVLKAYDSPLYVPFDKKVYFTDLGVQDLKFYLPSNEYDITFNIPPDTFLLGTDKFTLHLYYNYGAGLKDSSAINLFINGKFLKALPLKKRFGSILDDTELDIPVYMLNPGKNTLKIQYAIQAPGGGYCKTPNYTLLQGTVFSSKSYIKLPNLPHWREMAYMELFTTFGYPFSVYPDLKDSCIYISEKTQDTLSALYTLMAYIGEKTFVSPFNVNVYSSLDSLDKNKNIIAIGKNIPSVFFKNTPIKAQNGNLVLKYSLFKKIENTLKNRILGKVENKNLQEILKIKDRLTQETIFTEGESPFALNKTVLIITSTLDKNIKDAVEKIYEPKIAGNIKGDLAVVTNNKTYYANIGKKYYVGNLPFINYLLFRIGFSLPMLIVLFTVTILIIILIIKILLDIRERALKK